MVSKIYILRHGFRLNWVTSNWQAVTGLAKDPPLAAFGETQAQEVATYFSSLPEEERPTAIFSSPFYRCLQTSNHTSVALGVPIYVEHGLSEWFSPTAPGTGLHPRPAHASELTQYFSTIDPSGWQSIYLPSRKGEIVSKVHDRCGEFLDAFIPEIDRRFGNQHKVILLCSHAATTIALTRELVGDRGLAMRVGCCTLTEFVPKENPGGKVVGRWKVLKAADGAHLKEGSLRDWGFEDIEIANGEVVNDTGVPGTEGEVDDTEGLQLRKVTTSNL